MEEQEEDCHFPSLRRSANDITSHLEFNFGSLLRPSRGGRGQGRGGRGGMTEKVGLLSFRQDAGNHYIRAGGFIHFFTF